MLTGLNKRAAQLFLRGCWLAFEVPENKKEHRVHSDDVGPHATTITSDEIIDCPKFDQVLSLQLLLSLLRLTPSYERGYILIFFLVQCYTSPLPLTAIHVGCRNIRKYMNVKRL